MARCGCTGCRNPATAHDAYDVLLSRSRDGGFNWRAPVLVNTDGKQAEHGFVSLWPQSRDSIGVAWLDGAQPATEARTRTHGDITAAAGHASRA